MAHTYKDTKAHIGGGVDPTPTQTLCRKRRKELRDMPRQALVHSLLQELLEAGLVHGEWHVVELLNH